MSMLEHLKLIEKKCNELVSDSRQKIKDRVLDKNGGRTFFLLEGLRDIAIINYLLKHDIKKFRETLIESGKLQENLFDRFVKGDPISKSYLSLNSFQSVYDLLAANDIPSAQQLIKKMGNRADIEKEGGSSHVSQNFGYTLKAFLEDNPEAIANTLMKFTNMCQHKFMKNFVGYAEVFKGILEHDSNLAQTGFINIVKGHEKEAAHGLFQNDLDQYLCVWGIGMANLALAKGLAVNITERFIPAELLAPCQVVSLA